MIEKLDCKILEIEELESKLKDLQKSKKDLETEKGASESASDEQKKLQERVHELNIIAKKTAERDSAVDTRPVKTSAKSVQARAKSKDETDSNSSSDSNKNISDPASKPDRFASSKSKKSTMESERRLKEIEKEKAQDEEKMKRERQLLDDERKRLEETIRNLTEKQTELINKLHEAYDGTVRLNEQGTSSTDKELIIKLERLQAERDTYQKELTKIREQISNLVDSGASNEPGLRNQSPSCILQRLVTERDFYQKEFNRLQKQISNNVNPSSHDQSDVGELREKLNEKEREICCLKEKLRDLCAQQRVSPIQHPSQNGAILRLEMERDSAKADCSRLEEDRNALKEKLRNITELNKDEMQRLEQGSHALQTTITKLEVERRELMNGLAAAKSKIKMLEKKLDDYREQMQNQQTDLSQQISHLNHIKMLQEQTDRALSTSQDMLTNTETELASALERIHELEQQRLCLERELSCLRTERISLKSNMSMIDEEKDKLLLKVDEKTEQVVKLERDSKTKESRITHLESVLADMQMKLE
ncbi:centrosomal protein of 135 kDa-like [Nilaparvata lugens]|uniref:centrosomal protein of 135 kDa-like n=1 Tax=Nilaparvata lugens TaxID=108931 RepID=UPI00193E0971|nr:centrosomal protein of 135 kDa-like [Nilaparvata lugens]